MKKIILLIVLALAGVAAWYFWETKPKPNNEITRTEPVAVSNHSAAFNKSVSETMQAYYGLSDALVAWDTAKVASQTSLLQQRLSALSLEDLKKDSLVYQSALPGLQSAKGNVSAIASAQSLEQKRRNFHTLSQNMYDLLRTVRYDDAKVYLQECPMAFNDEESANWLSNVAEIRNPYLGMHHPKYKSGMLECGEVKDSIAFAGAQ